MHFPFLVMDATSGRHHRLTDVELAEVSLAPKGLDWAPGRAIAEHPDPVWAESLENAPVETISAVTIALEDLVLATQDLRCPEAMTLPDGRAGRHLQALISLWSRMGDALPPGLGVVRHVLSLPHGRFLAPQPVIEGSLDPLAPAAMKALHDRLRAEFGSVPAQPRSRIGLPGSRLHALQAGVAALELDVGDKDGSITIYGLRDAAACADFAAARARALIEGGTPARDIAILSAADLPHVARACAAQGVPLSGLPAAQPRRDIHGELALHLALAKRPPTPAMVLASIALSPLMPWSIQTGRDLAESVMTGRFRGDMLAGTPAHQALWNDIRGSASGLAQLRFLMDRICEAIEGGDQVRARLPIPPGEGSPDWEAILRGIPVSAPIEADPVRNLEGVSLWPAHETPWRPCAHLIVADFTEGLHPQRPRANPLFLDSEIAAISRTTGLALRGRAAGLAHGLALFDSQLQAVSRSVTFLVPRRDLTGARLQPSTGLSLVARVFAGRPDPAALIDDPSITPPADPPVAWHDLPPPPPIDDLPEALTFPGHALLELRRKDDGTAKPQSPSRLEVMLVSPLAWLMDEIGARDMSWSAEDLDIRARGNIAHEVFEHVFPPAPVASEGDLRAAIPEAFDQAMRHNAPFLRSSSWEMERRGLEREITEAACRWREHLLALGANIIGNEIWLAGEAHGINLHGKTDTILELPNGALLIVDHKKSGTSGRRRRMERGWDLQAGLYRDMLARPTRHEDDGLDALIGRDAGIAYHLMNDGGLLSALYPLPEGGPARDMGQEVGDAARELLAERLAELGAGRVVLNTDEDEDFFTREAGFTPYALTDGSHLVRAFIRQTRPETEEH